jgi:protein-tyrosine phosphatase
VEKVLFVCTANVCRSPMAAEIFNALAEDAGLTARAESAGVWALEEAPADESAVAVLEEAGITSLQYHRRGRLNEKVMEEADLVLTMSPSQVEEIERRLPEFSEKVYTLPAYLGMPARESIPDPHGQPMVAYRSCLRQLHEYIRGLVGSLEQDRS